jgi:acetyl esterase/lipase
MAAELRPLQVPARAIPVPASIGSEARAVLSAAAQTAMQWAAYPAQDDADGWRAYRAVADANMHHMFSGTADQLPPRQVRLVEAGPVRAFHITDPSVPKTGKGARHRILLFLHGGALIAGGGKVCETLAILQSVLMDAVVYAPDYRMPPEHPFPTPLEDCLAIYRHVIDAHGARDVVVHGMSAGGNLAAALLLRARADGLPMPAGLILETPELDFTESGDSFEINAIVDSVLQRRLDPINRLYADGADLANPYLSPLFGDVAGFPHTLLTAGTRDMFLSNAVRMHHRLRAAQVKAELLVYEAMPHGGFFNTPEDALVKQDIRRFAGQCWAMT